MRRLNRYSLHGLALRGQNIVRTNMGEVVTRHLAAMERAVSDPGDRSPGSGWDAVALALLLVAALIFWSRT